jgi:NADPH:quinone reductase-like Zn-dependent oxidoreductase
MKAIVLSAGATSIDAVQLVERDKPVAGPGEILVRMKAASLNFRDLGIIVGKYFGGPVQRDTVLGSDGAGEVEAVGESVTRFKPGDRVAGTFFQDLPDGPADPMSNPALGHSADGVLTEYMVIKEGNAVALPENLSYEEGACLPCAALTAWHAMMQAGKPVKEGDTVLALGTGGVSMFALQFATAVGAKVIITSSNDEKLAKAKAMGASGLINYKTHPEWQDEVRKLTDGKGVDCVVEVGGIGTIDRSMQCLALGGKIGMIGVLAGAEGECNPRSLMLTGSAIHGIFVGNRRMFEEMNKAIEINDIHPVIDKVFPLEDTVEAIGYFKSQAHLGKVVIRIG